ncbi:MAG: HoxN/HupN/NixA family nickel/cobalt transporter [Actinomycetota bacterium]
MTAARTLWHSLDPGQRRSLAAMGAAIGGLHAAGLTLLVVVAGPHHVALGIGVTAYALGLRHAFDADHIAAIDNTTRTLMQKGTRPLSVGFWFSLGHSTIVFALSFVVALSVRSAASGRSTFEHVASTLGTLVSGTFLYAIAALNIAALAGIVRMLARMRRGAGDAAELDRHLARRGLMARILGGLTRRVARPAQMYPVGLLFGLGFDTATEVALLVLAGSAAGSGMPWLEALSLPILFAAGMALLDTIDGAFMTVAYGWAFVQPGRKVFYNLTVTGLSAAVALVIGSIELGGLLASRLGWSGPVWSRLEHVDLNVVGFGVVAVFALTWAVSVAVWRLGRLADGWS